MMKMQQWTEMKTIQHSSYYCVVQEMKRCCDNESELASRLLLRIFAIDPRLQAAFHLSNVPYFEMRKNQLFELHVKVINFIL